MYILKTNSLVINNVAMSLYDITVVSMLFCYISRNGALQPQATPTLMSVFGSNRKRQPTRTVVVLTMPAETKLLGLGSISGSTAMPNPFSWMGTDGIHTYEREEGGRGEERRVIVTNGKHNCLLDLENSNILPPFT